MAHQTVLFLKYRPVMIQRFRIFLFLGTTLSQLLEIMNSNNGSVIPVAALMRVYTAARFLGLRVRTQRGWGGDS